MPRFGTTPPEPPAIRGTDELAPGVARAVETLMGQLADAGHPVRIRESWRSPERQVWLYGIGRDYDPDGRGNPYVTSAATGERSWHSYRLAVDFEDLRGREINDATVELIEQLCGACGLSSGATWQHVDRPHVQWGACPKKPTVDDEADCLAGNIDAVIARYGADA